MDSLGSCLLRVLEDSLLSWTPRAPQPSLSLPNQFCQQMLPSHVLWILFKFFID